MEKACLIRLNARVEEEDESRHGRITDAEGSGWKDIVRAIQEFWSALTIKPLPELINLAVIVGRHINFDVTQVTLCLAAFLHPGKVRIDVSFAPSATERAIFTEVDGGYFTQTLSVVILSCLRQWLDHEAEGDHALLLHFLIRRGLHCCRSHEPWSTLALINRDLRHRGCRREIH